MTGMLMNRRAVLAGSGAAIGCGLGAPLFAGAANAQVNSFRWGSIQPGFTITVTNYIIGKKLDQKHGFNVGSPTLYTSYSTYYNDFVAGASDIIVIDWNSTATLVLRGVPVRFLCRITDGNMINILTGDSSIKKVDDLRGKTIAASQTSGFYRMTRALIKEYAGFDLEKDATVQNVPQAATAISLVRAGRASAAFVTEPNTSAALKADPNLRIMLNTGEYYKLHLGSPLPYFGVAVRQEFIDKDPTIVPRLNAMFKDCVDGILGNTNEAVALIGERAGVEPEVLKAALTSGRLNFSFASMRDPAGRADVQKAVGFFAKAGVLSGATDDKLFAV